MVEGIIYRNNIIIDFVIGKHRRVYTPLEVSYHNVATDCWISLFQKVYDLTELVKQNDNELSQPIIRNAGLDVTKWFDKKTRTYRQKFDENKKIMVPDLPEGRFIHVPPSEPVSNWATDFKTPWWDNDELVIGSLSARTRYVDIINTLTEQECRLEVSSEETLMEILDRYLEYNSNANSYTWKVLDKGEFRVLDMDKTLDENGIINEADEFDRLDIPEDYFYPIIHLYYNDDLI